LCTIPAVFTLSLIIGILIWLAKFFAQIYQWMSEPIIIFMDIVGYTIWAVFGVGFLFFPRLEKLRQRKKFLSFWNKLVAFQTKFLAQLNSENEQFYFVQLKNLHRFLCIQIIVGLLYIIILFSWIVYVYGTSSFDVLFNNMGYHPKILFFFWETIIIIHYASSFVTLTIVKLFGCMFQSLNNAVTEKSCPYVETILNLYKELESLVAEFNNVQLVEHFIEIIVSCLQVVCCTYTTISDELGSMGSILNIFVLSYGIMFAKHIWDYCHNGSLLTHVASRILKNLENLDQEKLDPKTKQLVTDIW